MNQYRGFTRLKIPDVDEDHHVSIAVMVSQRSRMDYNILMLYETRKYEARSQHSGF